jgi:hypothetical protein
MGQEGDVGPNLSFILDQIERVANQLKKKSYGQDEDEKRKGATASA